MNTMSSLMYRGVRFVRPVSRLSLIAVISFVQIGSGQVTNQDVKVVRKMIDDIANRNLPPTLVRVRRPGWPDQIPRFPADWDWNEQDRVRSSLSKLHKDTTIELWEEMVQKADDQRYSLTVKDISENPTNRSVGYFCRHLAYSRLVDVFRQHLPTAEGGRKPWLDIGVDAPDIAAWRQQRMKKRPYQLQIEVCERAINALSNVNGFSRRQINSTKQMIESEIKKLRQTKQPIFLESNVAGLDLYSAEEAKDILEKLK